MAASCLSATHPVTYPFTISLSAGSPSRASSPVPTSPSSCPLNLSPFSDPTSPYSGFTTLLGLDDVRAAPKSSGDGHLRHHTTSEYSCQADQQPDKVTLRRSGPCFGVAWSRSRLTEGSNPEFAGEADEREDNQQTSMTPSEAGTSAIYNGLVALTRCAPSLDIPPSSLSKSSDWRQHDNNPSDNPDRGQSSLPTPTCDGLARARLEKALAGISMTRVRRIDSESSAIGSSAEAGLSFSVYNRGNRYQPYKTIFRKETIRTIDGFASCSDMDWQHGPQGGQYASRKIAPRQHNKDTLIQNQSNGWELEYGEAALDDEILETDPAIISTLWSMVKAANQYWVEENKEGVDGSSEEGDQELDESLP